MIFENARYNQNQNVIIVSVDGVEMNVPNDAPDNRHFAEIQRQVAAGDLVIQPSPE